MRAMVCERCGSKDVVERDSGWACEACGVRYGAEGLGVASAGGGGAVGACNLRRLALRAQAEGNAEAGARYYGRLLEADPDDWEANLWAPFFEGERALGGDPAAAARSFAMSVATVVGLVARRAASGGVPVAALSESLECASAVAVDAARSATGAFLRLARREGEDEGDLADALAACASPLSSLARSLDGTLFRDGEREAAAPYAEEARVRARQMAQRAPEAVRRESPELADMLRELPSVDVGRLPSAAWEAGLDGVGFEDVEAILDGRVYGRRDDDEPRGLLRELTHRVLDALLRALDGTPIADLVEKC